MSTIMGLITVDKLVESERTSKVSKIVSSHFIVSEVFGIWVMKRDLRACMNLSKLSF